MKLITKKQKHILALWMFKHYPVLGSILMNVYVGVLIEGQHLTFVHNTASNSFIGMLCILFLMINFVLMFVSDILGFCWLHRAMFAYMGLVGSCISYEYFLGFGNFLFLSRIVVFLVGLCLNIYVIRHWSKYRRHNARIRLVC